VALTLPDDARSSQPRYRALAGAACSPETGGKAASHGAAPMSKPAVPDCLRSGTEPGAGIQRVDQFAERVLRGRRMPAEAARDGRVRESDRGQAGRGGLLLAWPANVWMARPGLVNGSEWLYLPGTPWSLRVAGGSGGRPALEVYAAGSLVDVMVASSRASRLLRGACREAAGSQARTSAWGCLPTPRGELPSVEFTRGRIRHRARPAAAQIVVGWFWFADTDGRFSQVAVASQGRSESCRIPTAGAC